MAKKKKILPKSPSEIYIFLLIRLKGNHHMGKFKNQIPILYAQNTHRVHRLTYFQIVMDKFIGLLTVIFMFPKVFQITLDTLHIWHIKH